MPVPASGVIRGVQHTRELTRILALPRRDWTDETAAIVAGELTPLLKKPAGTMVLRPVQGQALLEAGLCKGGFFPIRVGGGKTLLSGLLPWILDSERPLLLLPAKLIEKTRREFRALAGHWRIPNFIRMISYELLGRVQGKHLLDQYQPDLIIADEAHKLRNRKAACTKVVNRYLQGHPLCQFVAMSGTMTKRSLGDFAHLLTWALKAHGSPLPQSWTELDDWKDALDEKKAADGRRLDVGALRLLHSADEARDPDELNATRRAWQRRLSQTPGVVATSKTEVDCSLTIEALWGPREVIMDPIIDTAFEYLRKFWRAPDDWPLADPMSVWRVARELALGFYYVWNPRPPDRWANARKAWASCCRDILMNNRRDLDSELQVTNAVRDGLYPEATPYLEEWRAVKDTFKPNSVPVWLDHSAVKAAREWALEKPGLVWCEHTAFAEALAKRANLTYYGRQGRDSRGRMIEAHNPRESLIASMASSGEGRNLQAWSRALVTSWPANGLQSEQLLGRHHRPGQEADEVIFDVMVTSVAHIDAFDQAKKDARYIEASTGQPQKLLYADCLIPEASEVRPRPGYRWFKKS